MALISNVPADQFGRKSIHMFGLSPTKILLTLVLAGVAGLGALCWMCLHNAGIPFLPQRPGADWIIYPTPPTGGINPCTPTETTFRCAFKLDTVPARAVVTLCAFKSFALMVNGRAAQNFIDAGKNWKSPSTLDITKSLHAGPNEIIVCVTNSQGPPALWLQCRAGQISLGTGTNWMVSEIGGTPVPIWQNAVAATESPAISPGNPFYGQEKMFVAASRAWPLLLLFCAVSIILLFALDAWRRRYPDADREKLVYALLVLVIIARVALFINDAPKLSQIIGFDAPAHERYVQFIQQKHALPTAADGFEMYQPPLYYLCGAGLLNACALSTGDPSATLVLRTVNGVVGVIQCVLSLLCLRLLFPKNAGAQAAGLLIAALIPPELFLSFYVTNESLAALFATAVLYFLLRILRCTGSIRAPCRAVASAKAGRVRESAAEEKVEKTGPSRLNGYGLYLALGANLGAALLTKSSSLPLLPFIVLILWLHFHWQRRPFRDQLRFTGIFLISCLIICGFYYGKIWAQYGELVKGNWESFWQYPGFRTSAYYFSFGHVFVAPLFSGLWSFGDGIYSTLWGDGLISGAMPMAVRPPWNYSLMDLGYILSAFISIIFIIGFVVALFRFIRQRAVAWLLMPGGIALFGSTILYLTLRAPFSSANKAFYALPALVPFSAVIALGFVWLTQPSRAHQSRARLPCRSPAPRGTTAGEGAVLQKTFWLILLVWSMTVFASFWVRSGNPQTWLDRGIGQFEARNHGEAVRSFTMAAQLVEAPNYPRTDPAFALIDGQARFFLGQFCQQDGNSAAALDNYQKAVDANNNYAPALNNLAWILATSADPAVRNGSRAVQLAKHACELTQFRQDALIGTLAAAYGEAGRFDEAIATARMAITTAQLQGNTNSVRENHALLQTYLAHQSYHEGK